MSMVDESIRIENNISTTGNGNIEVIIQLKAPWSFGVTREPRIQFHSDTIIQIATETGSSHLLST